MSADDDYAEDYQEWIAEGEPIDGAELLDDLRATLTRYVVFPNEHAAAAVPLWIATTHALPAFDYAPRLVLCSPEKRCAKSRVLDIIAATCHKPLATADATVAAIFRSLGGKHPPTLIIDEADTMFGTKKVAEQNEDLRRLLNAGHQRGRPALRCVGPLQTPTEFQVFAMAALAAKGIGVVPDTITDRAVNITMRRRAPGERVSQFRTRHAAALAPLRERLAEWVATQAAELAKAEPAMPVAVEDRAADTWEPLVAVADAAGGHWPKTARAACKALVAAADEADEEHSLAAELLRDTRTVFGDRDRMLSADIIAALASDPEARWADLWGKPLDQHRLAKELKPYGVRSKTLRIDGVRGKGYRVDGNDGLRQAWARYVPARVPVPTVPPVPPQVDGGGGGTDTFSSRATRAISVPAETPIDLDFSENGTPGTPGTGIAAATGGHAEGAPAFVPPTGPGRCPDCGWDVPTQGHRPDCTANDDGPPF
jgi:hypothetical protein